MHTPPLLNLSLGNGAAESYTPLLGLSSSNGLVYVTRGIDESGNPLIVAETYNVEEDN